MNLYFSQLSKCKWAMEPVFLETFMSRIAELPQSQIINDIEVMAKPRTLTIANGRAVIDVKGVLLKSVPSWLRFWGIEATGYDEIKSQLGQAMADTSVNSIHLQIESPGGIIDGLADVADMIYAIRQDKSKTVTASIEDLGASAAYWIASQAEMLDANKTAEVGSIGVYCVYHDMSKMAGDIGIKVIVIKSGEHKGMGVPGTAITDSQIAAVQENIDALAGQFIEAVARGRAKEADKIKSLATGQLWIADKAKLLGLVDGVNSLNQKQNSIQGETNMENNSANTNSVPAVDTKALAEAAAKSERDRMKQLNDAFADDLEFAVKAFNEGWSVEKAKGEYCDVLKKKLAAVQQKPSSNDNPEPLGTEDTDSGNSGDFIQQARELCRQNKITMTAAMKQLSRQKPELHKAYIEKSRQMGKEIYKTL